MAESPVQRSLKAPATRRRGALAATGGILARVARGYIWTITGNMAETRASIKRTRDNVQRLLDSATAAHRQETFDEAVARMGLTQSDLDERQRRIGLMAYFFGLILVVSLVLLLISPWSLDPVSHVLMTGGVAVMSFVRLLVLQFRMAQLREKRLFSLRDWLMSSKRAAPVAGRPGEGSALLEGNPVQVSNQAAQVPLQAPSEPQENVQGGP
jgi:hypothetical protein